MARYERRERIDGLFEQKYFNRFNDETKRDIIRWLIQSGRIQDWEIYDIETNQPVITSTKERIDRIWNDEFANKEDD